jgi:hypothetical protein
MLRRSGLVGLLLLPIVALVCAPVPARESAAPGSLDAHRHR